MKWFDVDKAGLRQIVERRGKGFIVCELVQNSLDEPVKRVDIDVKLAEGRPLAALTVEDDSPDGFRDLRDAFTLFAPSYKKGDPTKRGFLNLGEKLVIAMCDEASIVSTKGGVRFDDEGRHTLRSARERGTLFSGTLKLTRAEFADLEDMARRLLVPENVAVYFNGVQIPYRKPIKVVEASLPTMVATDGVMTKVVRPTTVNIVPLLEGEVGCIYEMGIPVVETGDAWHADVQQKVPVNMERDNLPPAYLRKIRTLVLNATHELLTAEQANDDWVRNATNDPNCSQDAMKRVLDLRFGEKRVAYDLSDPEANKRATEEGYTVVHGRMLSGQEWTTAKGAGLIKPAGVITPSPKPFSPDGAPLKVIEPANWTPEMKAWSEWVRKLAKEVLGHDIEVVMANDAGWGFSGTYGPSGVLHVNVARKGYAWFRELGTEAQIAFLIHEWGHEYSPDHLSVEYHDALCRIGARIAVVLMQMADVIRAHREKQRFHEAEGN